MYRVFWCGYERYLLLTFTPPYGGHQLERSGHILTHILGKQILQMYLERCLFRFLQAFSPTISRLQILHRRLFRGLRPDFLINTNFHGTLSNSIITICHYYHLARERLPSVQPLPPLGGEKPCFAKRETRNLEKTEV